MDCSSLAAQSTERQARTKKFTEANIRQIINLVERGTMPAEIAGVIGDARHAKNDMLQAWHQPSTTKDR